MLSDQATEVLYLSDTYEGKTHDKTICEEEECHYGSSIELGVDLGYLGYSPKGVTIIIPEKKPKNKELTEEQKKNNRKKAANGWFQSMAIQALKGCAY